MTSVPRVAVVTPVRNAEQWISQTVKSVIEQNAFRSGRATLDYVIMDGQSTDGTVAKAVAATQGQARVISRADGGMYSALAAGFEEVRAQAADVVAYLNAADLWHPTAIDTVLDVFDHVDVNWVTGLRSLVSPGGYTVQVDLPYRYLRDLIRVGVYGRGLPPIQQESTFWRGQLLSLVDRQQLASYRLAGDFYLWHAFAGETELYVVSALLAGFRLHGTHLSDDKASYIAELQRIADVASPKDHLRLQSERFAWNAPDWYKRRYGSQRLFLYDPQLLRWQRGWSGEVPA